MYYCSIIVYLLLLLLFCDKKEHRLITKCIPTNVVTRMLIVIVI